MNDRNRLAAREFEAELAAIEAREREERERPIREAEQKLQETHRQLAATMRDRLLGKVRDPELFVSPEVATLRMTRKRADEFVSEQAKAFFRANPALFSEELAAMINAYFQRNGIELFTSDMLYRLVERFAEYGLLPERIEPELQPEPEQPEPSPEIQQEPRKAETFEGWDPLTGEPRSYTAREVDLMDSLTYRKCFRIYIQQLGRKLPWLAPEDHEV